MIDNVTCISDAAIAFPETLHRVFFCQCFQTLYYRLIIFDGLVTQAAPAQA